MPGDIFGSGRPGPKVGRCAVPQGDRIPDTQYHPIPIVLEHRDSDRPSIHVPLGVSVSLRYHLVQRSDKDSKNGFGNREPGGRAHLWAGPRGHLRISFSFSPWWFLA